MFVPYCLFCTSTWANDLCRDPMDRIRERNHKKLMVRSRFELGTFSSTQVRKRRSLQLSHELASSTNLLEQLIKYLFLGTSYSSPCLSISLQMEHQVWKTDTTYLHGATITHVKELWVQSSEQSILVDLKCPPKGSCYRPLYSQGYLSKLKLKQL